MKQCSLCPFKTKFILQMSLHFTKMHNQLIHRICSYCITAFDNSDSLYNHQEEVHGLPRFMKAEKNNLKKPTTSAINGSLKVYTVLGNEEEDLFEFMMDKKSEINSIILLNRVRKSQKVQLCAPIELEKPLRDEDDDESLSIFVRSIK